MGLTYDGITYRSLEEQVRYDAEQVQLLKQADVTINENLQTVNESLQTINTALNGKLTKPANPSAESAVTMLADGTVGTKLLSEIGGNGGKLYSHAITLGADAGYCMFNIISSRSSPFTMNELSNLYNMKFFPAVYNGPLGQGVLSIHIMNGSYTINGVLRDSSSPAPVNKSFTLSGSDAVTEL